MNRANYEMPRGRLALDDEDMPNPVQWKCVSDVECSERLPQKIEELLRSGCGAFERYWKALVSVAVLDYSAKSRTRRIRGVRGGTGL